MSKAGSSNIARWTRAAANRSSASASPTVLADGLSMVYSFYEPEEEKRSLGTFMILDHIERAQRLGLPHVYLGYWVAGLDENGL